MSSESRSSCCLQNIFLFTALQQSAVAFDSPTVDSAARNLSELGDLSHNYTKMFWSTD